MPDITGMFQSRSTRLAFEADRDDGVRAVGRLIDFRDAVARQGADQDLRIIAESSTTSVFIPTSSQPLDPRAGGQSVRPLLPRIPIGGGCGGSITWIWRVLNTC